MFHKLKAAAAAAAASTAKQNEKKIIKARGGKNTEKKRHLDCNLESVRLKKWPSHTRNKNSAIKRFKIAALSQKTKQQQQKRRLQKQHTKNASNYFY